MALAALILVACEGSPPSNGSEGSESDAPRGDSEPEPSPTDGGTSNPDSTEGEPGPADVEVSLTGNTLWIGNSLVRFGASGPYSSYDIPDVVQDLRAAAQADTAQTMRVLAQSGFGLDGWWNSWYGYIGLDGETVSAARAIVEDPECTRNYDGELGYTALPEDSGGWDRVILLSLANYVGESAWYGSLADGAVVPWMEQWYAYVEDQDPATEILHYVGVTDAREIATRQPPVDALYDSLQEEWGGRIVPVGRAFYDAHEQNPSLTLRRELANDYIHFNDRGVYLAACVFYGVLYGDPTGLPVTSELAVADDEATFLQSIARAAVVRANSAAF